MGLLQIFDEVPDLAGYRRDLIYNLVYNESVVEGSDIVFIYSDRTDPEDVSRQSEYRFYTSVDQRLKH